MYYHTGITRFVKRDVALPHAVIVTIRDNGDSMRVLLYPCCTTVTGWWVYLAWNRNDTNTSTGMKNSKTTNNEQV